MTSITRQFSQYLAALGKENFSSEVVLKVKHCLIDYLAAAWCARNDSLGESYRLLALQLGSRGMHGIIGGSTTCEAFATFANGALGHVREVDDLHRDSTMHVGITVFPPLLALAQTEGFDASRFIAAVVVGYEAAIRIGQTLGREHYATFHTTATAGTFGAAAACASYLGLDPGKMTDALGHAGSQAAGLWQFLSDGALGTKPLHAGKAAMNGLIAARLAADGVEGASHILEGAKGFGKIAAPNADWQKVLENIGSEPYMIEEICFKNYPCCGQTHSMLDALRIIMHENNLSGEDITHVHVLAYRQAMDLTSNPDPQTLGQARFSLPFCMGILLSSGDLFFNDINEQALRDASIRSQSKKISMEFDEEVDKLFPQTRPCIVIVTDIKGRKYIKRNLYRRGDPELPMTTQDMEKKFESLTSGILSPEAAKAVLDWAENIERQTEIPEFVFSGNVRH